jgi:hypothetical protein
MGVYIGDERWVREWKEVELKRKGVCLLYSSLRQTKHK